MIARSLAIAAILAVTLPGPARALSCMSPSPIAWVELARTSGGLAIVYGQLGADAVFEGVEMRPGEPDLPVRFTVPEEQTRHHMGWIAGPAAPIRGPVSPMPLDRPFVGPVSTDGGGHSFLRGVCGPNYVTEPSAEMLQDVRICLDGGRCER